jgi:hypothetical protein
VATSLRQISCGSVRAVASRGQVGPVLAAGSKETWWSQHREASLNWLALGLLLAAWNASDNDGAQARRPEALRGYSSVSVRAASLYSEARRASSRN